MTTLMDTDTTRPDRATTTNALVGIAGIHLLLGIAASAAGSANLTAFAGFSWWSGAPLFVALASTPVIAHSARTLQPWVSLAGAVTVAFAGSMLTILADAQWVWITGVVASALATTIAAAVLLVTAWRSRPEVTALLAGVFVLSETLSRAIIAEYFAQSFSGDDDISSFVGLEYLAVGSVLAASLLLLVVRTMDDTPSHEHGLSAIDRIAAALAIGGAAFALTNRNVTDGTMMIVVGLVIFGAGVAVAQAARVNGWTDTVPFHLDARILVLCGAAVACMALVDLADLGLRSPFLGESQEAWRRGLDIIAVALIVPAVVLASHFPRPVLSGGAILGAAYAAVRFLDVTGDEPLDQRWLLTGRLMADLAVAVLLGGTVALGLQRTDHASIEVGVIVFLAGAVLIRGASAELGLQYIGNAWREADTSPFRDLTLVGAAGLSALAIWWAGAASDDEPTEENNDLGDRT